MVQKRLQPERSPTVSTIPSFLKPAVLHAQSLILRVTRGITFGVRGLVTDGEQVLLVRHSYVPGWYLPGGAVEPGETALASLDRELDEEAGLAIDDDARLHGLFFHAQMARRDHVAVYVVPRWRVLRRFEPTREILESRFFPIDDLPADSTTATRARVAEHLGRQPLSPYW